MKQLNNLNQATQRKKMKIARAFMSLLERSPIERISVKEIMEKAEFSSRTFYNLFTDKYDIPIFWWRESISPFYDGPYKEYQHQLISLLHDHRSAFKNIFKYIGPNNLHDEMARDMTEKLCLHVSNKIYQHETKETVDFYIRYFQDVTANSLSITVEHEGYKDLHNADMDDLTHKVMLAIFEPYFQDEPLPDKEHIEFTP